VCARIDYLVLLVLSDSPQQIANQNDAHFEPRSLRTVTVCKIIYENTGACKSDRTKTWKFQAFVLASCSTSNGHYPSSKVKGSLNKYIKDMACSQGSPHSPAVAAPTAQVTRTVQAYG
jgi:hypothetical protein